MKIALAMIVKPDAEEAQLLDRCLQSVHQHVDGIFITQAGKEPSPDVAKVISNYGGYESFYKWNNSFADARNFNFAQVPADYDYILWLDADDVVRDADKIKATVEQNASVDVFSFWYLYAFDEWKNPIVVHHKSRVIRNDGCVKWVGDLHEDFEDTRTITRKHVNGIEVLHLTTDARVETSKYRNEEVAKAHLKHYPDDPRSFWVIANSQKAVGKNDEAIESFTKFLKTSFSDDEKYIAHMRIAEAQLAKGEQTKAVDSFRYAIGMKPLYPDAYIALGRVYYDMGLYADAVSLLKQSLNLPPPYYSIVVYNPRDYDYTPLKWLAYCYIAIRQPMLAYDCFTQLLKITPRDEKLKDVVKKMKVESDKHQKLLEHYALVKTFTGDTLKAALDVLPIEWQAAPEFTNLRNINFVKKESSGKDLVILCGFTDREWNPDSVKEGIGGSEEAVIHLARRYKKAGWNVTVYNNCGHIPKEYDGVMYRPFWTWNYRDKQDVVVLWRHPKMLDFDINAPKIFIDLHDVVKPGEFTDRRVARVTKIFVKSQFHRSLYAHVPDEKFVVVPNGIQSSDFAGDFKKDPMLLVNTSSPDRSLSTLLRLYARVKEQVPEAKLEWAYGWDVFDVVHGTNDKVMKWKAEQIEQMQKLGVVNRGRVSHKDVADMYKRARIFAYPTEFAEIDCISARKAQAAGAIPVTTDFAALNETVQYGYKVHSNKTKDDWCLPYQSDFALNDPIAEDIWVTTVVQILKSEPGDWAEMREWTQQFDWENIAAVWLKEFTV